MLRDLDRRHPDPTGAGVNEDAFAAPKPGHILQGVPRGHENDRQCGGFFKSEVTGKVPHIAGAGDGVGGEAENGETENTIAGRDMRDLRTDRPNDTGHFVTKDARVRCVARIERERLEHVAEIHSGRFHFDQHLTALAGR
jgi:hypothetical protein